MKDKEIKETEETPEENNDAVDEKLADAAPEEDQEDVPAVDASVEDQEDTLEENNDAVDEKYVGKELNISQPNGAKFKGFCIGERKTNSGEQVFLKINAHVSRWFNVADIV